MQKMKTEIQLINTLKTTILTAILFITVSTDKDCELIKRGIYTTDLQVNYVTECRGYEL